MASPGIRSLGIATDGETERVVPSLPSTVLGKGACRVVYDMGTLVLKVARRPDRLPFNLAEADLWTKVAGTASAVLFAPVLYCHPSGLWLIQQRASCTVWQLYGIENGLENPVVDASNPLHCGVLNLVHRWQQKHSDVLGPYGISDVNPANLGVMPNGSWVLIDYAPPLYPPRGPTETAMPAPLD